MFPRQCGTYLRKEKRSKKGYGHGIVVLGELVGSGGLPARDKKFFPHPGTFPAGGCALARSRRRNMRQACHLARHQVAFRAPRSRRLRLAIACALGNARIRIRIGRIGGASRRLHKSLRGLCFSIIRNNGQHQHRANGFLDRWNTCFHPVTFLVSV